MSKRKIWVIFSLTTKVGKLLLLMELFMTLLSADKLYMAQICCVYRASHQRFTQLGHRTSATGKRLLKGCWEPSMACLFYRRVMIKGNTFIKQMDIRILLFDQGFPCHNNHDMLSKWCPGPWFNIKMSSYKYRKCHCGDKTILRPSYLHNGISYTGKMISLYWIRALYLIRCSNIRYFVKKIKNR